MSSACGGDNYVCTLDEKTLKKAKDELNEDEKNRMGSVETFRQWILQQPHIKCPTDTAFLLLFLRVRYYAQLEARKLLMKFLNARAKRSWYKDIDTADPKLQAAISEGPMLFLPERDGEGRKVVIFRGGGMVGCTKNGFKIDELWRGMACVLDYVYLLDEMTCVNGTVFILDMGDYTMKIHTSMSNEDRTHFIQSWQGSFPARIKQMHMYNAGIMLDIVWTVVKHSMEEKIQKRIKNQGQVLEGIYKDIPMRCLPVEYLPDDYKGPNAGTIQQVIKYMIDEMTKPEVRERMKYLSSSQFGINETLMPKDDIPQASFRKLNLD